MLRKLDKYFDFFYFLLFVGFLYLLTGIEFPKEHGKKFLPWGEDTS